MASEITVDHDDRQSVPKTDEKPSASYKCPCFSHPAGRNLVVCIDGTSNQYGEKNTNVIEFYSRLFVDNHQLLYYNSGIGTYARPSWLSLSFLMQVAGNKVDMAIAWNFEKVVKGAYRWLSDHYKTGDRIYLFGFSRGAYQVRALAGMIEKVGLIHAGNEEQIPFAYELYADLKKADAGDRNAAKQFKDTFSVEGARVHFIGAWDTVSSIGLSSNDGLPLTGNCNHVCFFRHALAFDECRVKFLPECVEARIDEVAGLEKGRVKEVWFPGSHSDVGGGNLSNRQLSLEGLPLLWMQNEALMAGLRFKHSKINWDKKFLEFRPPSKSLHGVWWILEYLPIRRTSHSHPEKKTRAFHRGKGRAIFPRQKVHASIAFASKGYQPKATFVMRDAKPEWKDIVANRLTGLTRVQSEEKWKELLELDIYDTRVIPDMLEDLEQSNNLTEEDFLHRIDRLSFLASLDHGLEAIFHSPKLFNVLGKCASSERVGLAKAALCLLCNLVLHDVQGASAVAIPELIKLPNHSDVSVDAQVISVFLSIARNGVFRPTFLPILLLTSHMAFFDILRGFLIEENTIRKILRVLSSPYLTDAVDVLQELSVHDDSRAVVSGTVPNLVDQMSKDDASNTIGFLLIFKELASHRDSRAILIDCGATAVLFSSLLNQADAVVRNLSSLILVELVNDDHSRVAVINAISNFVRNLRAHSPSIIRAVAPVLVELARYRDSRHELIKCDVIEGLLETLRSAHLDPNLPAITSVLLELGKHDESRGLMAGPGGLAILIEAFLKTSQQPNSNEIANVIKELASHDDSRSNLVKAGAVFQLIQRLYHDPENRVVASVLENLAKDVKDNFSTKLSEPECIDLIVKMIFFMRKTPARDAAAAYLQALVESDGPQIKLLKSGAIPAIIASFRDRCQSPGCHDAALALTKLIQHDDSQTAFVKPEFSSAFVKILWQEPGSPGGHASAFVLNELAKHDTTRRNLIGSEVVFKLLTVLRTKSGSSVSKATALVLQELTKHKDSWKAVASRIPVLLQAPWMACPETALVLRSLAEDGKYRSTYLSTKLAERESLLKVVSDASGTPSARTAAFSLQELVKHRKIREELAEVNGIPILLGVLSKASATANWQEVVSVLDECAKHDDFRMKFATSENIIMLLKLLSGTSRSPIGTSSILREFVRHDDSRAVFAEPNVILALMDVFEMVSTLPVFALILKELMDDDNLRARLATSSTFRNFISLIGKENPSLAAPMLKFIKQDVNAGMVSKNALNESSNRRLNAIELPESDTEVSKPRVVLTPLQWTSKPKGISEPMEDANSRLVFVSTASVPSYSSLGFPGGSQGRLVDASSKHMPLNI
ncbi:hypothetical protein Hypma_006109 [Hypsizygus marmoreus]|uniref:T6SS Phospholipase effector Tle1-like catalytic domain-containing protein n=1 Tax=Hypsizygus marmoreus TaxID=39966 RepID=A0A369JW70_HYPMA|nr:hypothetical protein Hypma_006109 [Hypsizygus marmoreus]